METRAKICCEPMGIIVSKGLVEFHTFADCPILMTWDLPEHMQDFWGEKYDGKDKGRMIGESTECIFCGKTLEKQE